MSEIRDTTVTPEVMAAMRAWLNADQAIDGTTDAQIVHGIAQHYPGGVAQFLRNGRRPRRLRRTPLRCEVCRAPLALGEVVAGVAVGTDAEIDAHAYGTAYFHLPCLRQPGALDIITQQEG